MYIDSNITPNQSLETGTKLVIKCSFDANPPAKLSIVYYSGSLFREGSGQYEITTYFEEAVTIAEDTGGVSYICQAESQSGQYVFFSEPVEFSIKCNIL